MDDIICARRLIEKGQVHEGLALLLKASTKGGRKVENVTKEYESVLERLEDKYFALGLTKGCEPKEVKKAYRRLVLKYHPDKNQHTTPIFQAIQNAYETLSEPKERKKYDRDYKPARHATAQPHPATNPRPQRRSAYAKKENDTSSYDRYHHGGVRHNRNRDQHGNQWQQQQHQERQNFQQQYYQQRNKSWHEHYQRQAQQAQKRQQQQHRQQQQQQQQQRQQQQYRYEQDKKAKATAKPVPEARAPAVPSFLKVLDVQAASCVLQWASSGHGCVYELQWREKKMHPAYAKAAHAGSGMKWEVVTALIRGTTCRKRNLRPGFSYEFRVRACGAWGKSIFAATAHVTTLTMEDAQKKSKAQEASEMKREAVKREAARREHLRQQELEKEQEREKRQREQREKEEAEEAVREQERKIMVEKARKEANARQVLLQKHKQRHKQEELQRQLQRQRDMELNREKAIKEEERLRKQLVEKSRRDAEMERKKRRAERDRVSKEVVERVKREEEERKVAELHRQRRLSADREEQRRLQIEQEAGLAEAAAVAVAALAAADSQRISCQVLKLVEDTVTKVEKLKQDMESSSSTPLTQKSAPAKWMNAESWEEEKDDGASPSIQEQEFHVKQIETLSNSTLREAAEVEKAQSQWNTWTKAQEDAWIEDCWTDEDAERWAEWEQWEQQAREWGWSTAEINDAYKEAGWDREQLGTGDAEAEAEDASEAEAVDNNDLVLTVTACNGSNGDAKAQPDGNDVDAVFRTADVAFNLRKHEHDATMVEHEDFVSSVGAVDLKGPDTDTAHAHAQRNAVQQKYSPNREADNEEDDDTIMSGPMYNPNPVASSAAAGAEATVKRDVDEDTIINGPMYNPNPVASSATEWEKATAGEGARMDPELHHEHELDEAFRKAGPGDWNLDATAQGGKDGTWDAEWVHDADKFYSGSKILISGPDVWGEETLSKMQSHDHSNYNKPHSYSYGHTEYGDSNEESYPDDFDTDLDSTQEGVGTGHKDEDSDNEEKEDGQTSDVNSKPCADHSDDSCSPFVPTKEINRTATEATETKGREPKAKLGSVFEIWKII